MLLTRYTHRWQGRNVRDHVAGIVDTAGASLWLLGGCNPAQMRGCQIGDLHFRVTDMDQSLRYFLALLDDGVAA